MTSKNWSAQKYSATLSTANPRWTPTGLNPSIRCMKPATDLLKFDTANSIIQTAAFCVVTQRFALLGYRNFGETCLFCPAGRKRLGVRKQRVQSHYSPKYTPCVTSKEDDVRSNMSRPTDISLQPNWFFFLTFLQLITQFKPETILLLGVKNRFRRWALRLDIQSSFRYSYFFGY
jgi:hypothetical protein